MFQGLLCAYEQVCCYGLDHVRLYGFDSLRWLPEPAEEHEALHTFPNGETSRFYAGQFAYPKAEVIRRLSRYGVDLNRITLVEGFYDETLRVKT